MSASAPTASVPFFGYRPYMRDVYKRQLLTFALPNFYFHVTTAYDILRHAGVPIGKLDFLGPYTA